MILTREQVYDLVQSKVNSNEPFSLLRYGDGEGLFAYGHNVLMFSRKYRNASIKHWGELPGSLYRSRISMNLIKSVRNCDIAGLPYGFKGDLWEFSLQMFSKAVKNNLAKWTETCSANIHIDMENDGFIKRIVKGRKVFVLSCRDVTERLTAMGAAHCDWLPISAQYKFEKNKPAVPFYKQIERKERDLSQMDLTGTICFLAAGVAGKNLGNIMRDQGGMVIDIGSVVDKWSGVHSRGWMKPKPLQAL